MAARASTLAIAAVKILSASPHSRRASMASASFRSSLTSADAST